MPLSDRDRALLDFEARWNGHGAAKEEAITRELDLTVPRYYQLLQRAVDQPDAAAYDALLVHRLRRLHDANVRARAARGAVRTGAAG
ncbi:DUF3263 domain-containing protein [Microbacterium sp. bgisy203]|uniref:DUF3263 domain-containing protein n=1 Tax=Microbacterium sp. bgisy203 TaxID=3413799 RepID=UPI003D7155CC